MLSAGSWYVFAGTGEWVVVKVFSADFDIRVEVP